VETKVIIPRAGPFGGGNVGEILHLPDALKRYPDKGIVLYNRVSSWGQAGKGKVRLEEKTDVVQRALRKIAGYGKLKWIVPVVEYGKMSATRPGLRRVIKGARERGLIVCAPDVSRFIRSEAYDRRTNNNAEPTPDEIALLLRMAGRVPLATLEKPTLTESERHSRATKRGECGRPRKKMKYRLAYRILEELGLPFFWNGRIIWSGGDSSLASVAKRFGVSKLDVQRLVDLPVPEALGNGNGRTRLRWKDFCNPARAFQRAHEQGLIGDEV
jgi:hypothetical protein